MIGRIIDLIGVSVRDPGAAIAALKGLGVGRRESWLTIFLAASVGAIMSWLLMRTLPGAEAGMDRLASQPMGMALLQVGAAALFAALVDRVGRLFGGTGRFEGASGEFTSDSTFVASPQDGVFQSRDVQRGTLILPAR